MTTATKQAKPVDLSEYAEEAIPFDVVTRKLGKTKPAIPEITKRKPAKTARKRTKG
jgi:hypothetical protein